MRITKKQKAEFYGIEVNEFVNVELPALHTIEAYIHDFKHITKNGFFELTKLFTLVDDIAWSARNLQKALLTNYKGTKKYGSNRKRSFQINLDDLVNEIDKLNELVDNNALNYAWYHIKMRIITEARNKRLSDVMRLFAIPNGSKCKLYIVYADVKKGVLREQYVGCFPNTLDNPKACELYLKINNQSTARRLLKLDF